jgi:carbon catabolite-derepressing protein kinase
MLCGRLPFDDDYIPTLFKKINGGIYHLPSWLSPDAKYLLSQMLIVDPVKRITIAEIRQLPWFQTNLPRYLQPMPFTPSSENGPPIGDLASLIAGDDPLNGANLTQRRGSDSSEASLNPEREARKRGWTYTYDLGVIDPKLVHELQGKMAGWQVDDIWDALKKEGDNQVKVAFQLIRDHRRMLHDGLSHSVGLTTDRHFRSADVRFPFLVAAGELEEDEETQAMESFLAQSPPAWNDPGPPLLDEPDEEEYEEDDDDEIPNSNFALLDSSLPGYAEGP